MGDGTGDFSGSGQKESVLEITVDVTVALLPLLASATVVN